PASPPAAAASRPSGPQQPLAPAAAELEPGSLPPQIIAMVSEITGVLCETFHTYPPHTIQRLAELILEPRRHYRSLPSYLHAVDRVVHVTSGNNIYPLPPAVSDMSHLSINGTADDNHEEGGSVEGEAGSAAPTGALVGSDEALGGALLTPIPWLARRGQGQGQGRQFEPQVRTESTETIEGPNGVGSIETVTVSINGISSMSAAQQQRVITQGELIRQEQKAGVVPVSQLARSGPVVASSPSAAAASTTTAGEEGADTTMAEGEGEGEDGVPRDNNSEKSDEDMADEDETPHARGPDIIGAADMGPQTPTSSTFRISSGGNVEVRRIDVEAAVGRKHEAQAPTADDEGATTTHSETSDDAVMTPPSTDSTERPAATQGEGEGIK
ncbi:hypothetical protein M406DRAFT_230316, partial [Cryphonectria parasitica EP155]